MVMMIDQKLVGHFAALIGYLNIAINLNSYSRVRNEYKSVLDELLDWVKYYYENKNLNIVNHNNSLRIHDLLEDIRNDIIFDKSMGIELEIADNILIRYEALVKMINDERGRYNGKR